MRRWSALGDVAGGPGSSVVTVGVFDGVHRGHRVGIARTVALARERGAAATVITFDPHPLSVLRPGSAPCRLASLDQRLSLLGSLGVDATLVLPFTAEVSQWSGEQFVDRVLCQALGAVGVVVGSDFRFGHRAAGDVRLLAELGLTRGFTVEALALAGDDERWSSTRVRAMVAAGEVEAATSVLGRPHRLEGTVVHGDHRGRDIGYPTANLALEPLACVPIDGVYAGWLTREPGREGARAWPAAVSIGTNPTFDGVQRRVETYVLPAADLDVPARGGPVPPAPGPSELDLYGCHVAVDFRARLRPTVRFDAVEDLVRQMRADVALARDLTT